MNLQKNGIIYKLLDKLRKNKILGEFFTPNALIQLIRYLITGVSSAALEFSILYVLTNYAHMWHIFSNSISVFVSFWFNFLLTKFWTFKSRNNFYRQLGMYTILFFINIGISNAVMYLFTDVLSFHYMLSKVVASGVIVCWNFVVYKKVIYK